MYPWIILSLYRRTPSLFTSLGGRSTRLRKYVTEQFHKDEERN